MDQTNNYHPRTKHSNAYYYQLILVFIKALTTRATDRQTADLLNSRAILSPVGKPWTASGVKQTLHKLRNFRDFPNKLHQVLLQLCFDGTLNPADTYILFQPRKPLAM